MKSLSSQRLIRRRPKGTHVVTSGQRQGVGSWFDVCGTRSSGNSNLTHLVLLRFVPRDPSLAGPATLAPSAPEDDLKDHQCAHEGDTQGSQDET
jgi:hypothetical protein